MDKNLYTLKLKSLSDQINIMLLEAEGDPTGMTGTIEQLAKIVGGDAAKAKVTELWGKAVQLFKKYPAFVKMNTPTEGEIAAGDDTKTYGLKAGILSLTALIVSGTAAVKACATGIDGVKDMTGQALGASNYKEFSKTVAALKKLSSNNSVWSKLTVSAEAKKLAADNLNAMKKGYITAGVAMILVSVVLVIVAGSAMDIVGSITEAVKSFNMQNLLKAIGKLVALGALALPGVIGVILIIVAMKGFTEEGMAAKIASALFPLMQLINTIIGKVTAMA